VLRQVAGGVAKHQVQHHRAAGDHLRQGQGFQVVERQEDCKRSMLGNLGAAAAFCWRCPSAQQQ
jgi:hypothetical protein